LSKKKNTQIEDGQQNGPAPFATGDAPAPEVAPPLPDDPSPSDESLGPEITPPPSPEASPQAEAPTPDPPVHAPDPSAPASPSSWDLQLAAAPVAQVAAPPAPIVMTTTDPALEERLRRLEAMLTQAQQNLQAAEQQRITERTQTTPDKGPSVVGQARALLDVGRALMPMLPAGTAPPKPKGWLVWEMIAELRAIFYMYTDPRYRLPWYGYVIPPVLFVAYLSSLYWVPFAHQLADVKLSWVLTLPVDMLLLYCTFKILGHEARRYRETAPDLPRSLRIDRDEPPRQ